MYWYLNHVNSIKLLFLQSCQINPFNHIFFTSITTLSFVSRNSWTPLNSGYHSPRKVSSHLCLSKQIVERDKKIRQEQMPQNSAEDALLPVTFRLLSSSNVWSRPGWAIGRRVWPTVSRSLALLSWPEVALEYAFESIRNGASWFFGFDKDDTNQSVYTLNTSISWSLEMLGREYQDSRQILWEVTLVGGDYSDTCCILTLGK